MLIKFLPQSVRDFSDNLSPAVRGVIFVVLMIVIFVLWYLALWAPLDNKKITVQKKITTLAAAVKLLQNDNALLQAKITQQRAFIKEQREAAISHSAAFAIILPQKISHTLKTLFGSTPGLNFIALDATPVAKHARILNGNRAFFEHDTTLKFSGSYFAVLSYLDALEKLHWPIYFDAINYTVTDYPKADITLQLHAFSDSENENEEHK